MKLPRITSSNVFSVLLVLCVLCCVVFDEKSFLVVCFDDTFSCFISEWAVWRGLKKEQFGRRRRPIDYLLHFVRTHTQAIHTKHGTHYIMIKPDGVQRGLIHKVIERFEQRGFYLKAMKMQMVTKERTRGKTLRGFELQAVFRWISHVHVLWPGRLHGLGRQGRRQDW